jgi:hypothetical protein
MKPSPPSLRDQKKGVDVRARNRVLYFKHSLNEQTDSDEARYGRINR